MVPTTPTDPYVYGDGLQSSAAMGGSPVVVMSVYRRLRCPFHTVSDEALLPVPGEWAADPDGPEGDEEAVLADPPEQMQRPCWMR